MVSNDPETQINQQKYLFLAVIAPIMTLLAIGLGVSIYIMSDQSQKIAQFNQTTKNMRTKIENQETETKNMRYEIKNMRYEINNKQTEINSKQAEIDRLKSTEYRHIPSGKKIIDNDQVSSDSRNNKHIFFVDETSTFDFRLSGLSSDADFVIIDINNKTIKSGTNNSGTTSDSLSFELQPGTYYVKVYLHRSTSSSTNYTLEIERK